VTLLSATVLSAHVRCTSGACRWDWNDMAVLLETTLGDIVIDLYTEERPKGN